MDDRSYYDYAESELAQLGERLRQGGRQVLLRGGAVITMESATGVLPRADVLIADGAIAAVGPDLAERGGHEALVIEARGTVIAPGFIDAHRHCWQGQLRRLIPDVNITGYWEAIVDRGLAEAYRPEDLYAGVLIALLGALDAGITTVVDFSHNAATAEHADAVFAAYRDAQARVVHVSCPPETDRWDVRWPEELVRLREMYCDADGRVGLRLGINKRQRAPVTELLAMARTEDLAITFDAISGDRASDLLQELSAAGTLGPDVNLTHCNALTSDAWHAIVESGASVTLAPLSDEHFGIADGLPPIQTCLDRGLAPAVGVDVESGLPSDMFSQLRCLLATQRMQATHAAYGTDGPSPRLLSTGETLEFATLAGARSVGLGGVTGSIAAGKAADLMMLGAGDVNTLPLNDPIGTVVLGADPRNILAVLVGGDLRKWDRQLVGQDVRRIRALAEASRDHLVATSHLGDARP